MILCRTRFELFRLVSFRQARGYCLFDVCVEVRKLLCVRQLRLVCEGDEGDNFNSLAEFTEREENVVDL